MEWKAVCCHLCLKDFSVPASFAERVSPPYTCERCESLLSRLQHPHALYLQASSGQELQALHSRLLGLFPPDAISVTEPSNTSPSLTLWYEQISLPLLHLIGSLRVRYSLHDLACDEDMLTFWPDYDAPKGVLADLIHKQDPASSG